MNQHSAGEEVQYVGTSGVTQDCVEAVERLLHRHDDIEVVRLITHSSRQGTRQAFLVTLVGSEHVVIRAGFASGYPGEGPKGLSRALNLIQSVGLDIEEYEADRKVFERLNSAKLSWDDLDLIFALRFVRPTRWYDYLDARPKNPSSPGRLWERVQPVIPLAVIDTRLFDLAVRFWDSPDDALMTGYRRLEGIVREKAGSEEYGAKLFSRAFNSDQSILMWDGISENEQRGRASLFAGTFMAFRNPRAHNESAHQKAEYLRELMMLNQLYALEASCVVRPNKADDTAT